MSLVLTRPEPVHRVVLDPPVEHIPPPRPRPGVDLAGLLAAAGEGQHAAWEELVRRYGGLLRHIGRRYGLTAEECSDIAQATWLLLFTRAHQIRNPDSLVGWLATTAGRECAALRRRERREIPTEDCGAEATEDADLDDRMDAVRRHRRLRAAVAQLPPRERALIDVLLEPDPPSYRQISARLGMPVGAIGPVRQRALRRLRRLLELDPAEAAASRIPA
jgi:RNA polymerase sigma factor (sigma-70 family)